MFVTVSIPRCAQSGLGTHVSRLSPGDHCHLRCSARGPLNEKKES